MRFGFLAALVPCVIAASPASAACGLEQFSIQHFTSEVDQWSDGSGNVVRLIGEIRSACQSVAQVELLIEADGEAGNARGQSQVWLSVPPGGIPFDLVGKIPYDPSAANYTIGIGRTK